MKIIQATDYLVIELGPAKVAADRPLLKLRSLRAESDGENQAVIIYLDEVRHLIDALSKAGVELASSPNS